MCDDVRKYGCYSRLTRIGCFCVYFVFLASFSDPSFALTYKAYEDVENPLPEYYCSSTAFVTLDDTYSGVLQELRAAYPNDGYVISMSRIEPLRVSDNCWVVGTGTLKIINDLPFDLTSTVWIATNGKPPSDQSCPEAGAKVVYKWDKLGPRYQPTESGPLEVSITDGTTTINGCEFERQSLPPDQWRFEYRMLGGEEWAFTLNKYVSTGEGTPSTPGADYGDVGPDSEVPPNSDPVNTDDTSSSTPKAVTTTTNADGSVTTDIGHLITTDNGPTFRVIPNADGDGVRIVRESGSSSSEDVSVSETVYPDGSSTTQTETVVVWHDNQKTVYVVQDGVVVSGYVSGGDSGGSTTTTTEQCDPSGSCTSTTTVEHGSGDGSGDGDGNGAGGGEGCLPTDTECWGDTNVGAQGDALPISNVELPTVSADGQQISASCPADLHLPVMSSSITVDMEPFCDMAGTLSYFILAGAWLFAAIIVGRGLGGM